MPAMPRQIVTLYYNPGCSKCRAARTLLEERGVPLCIVEYLKQPPTRTELAELRRKLGLPAERWIRKGEAAFAAAGLGPESPEEALLDAMAAHPILIERPIAVCGERAIVGRPAERVLELLDAGRPS